MAEGETEKHRLSVAEQRDSRERRGGGSPAHLLWRGNCIAKDLLLQV